MSKVITIASQKGGVGKTHVTVNLGAGLVRHGKRVLLIDADPQGSMTASLGIEHPDDLDVSLAGIMESIINDEDIQERKGILYHEEGMDFLPGNIELSGLEVSLVNIMSRESILRQYVDGIRENYDYILVDTTPSLGMLTINALAAADSVIIPVQPEYLSIKGLQQLIRTIGKVRKQINRNLTIEGIVLTMTDSRTTYARDLTQMLLDAYGGKVQIFDAKIPYSVRAKETSAEGVSIFRHDPKGKVAAAYEKLTEEVLVDEK